MTGQLVFCSFYRRIHPCGVITKLRGVDGPIYANGYTHNIWRLMKFSAVVPYSQLILRT